MKLITQALRESLPKLYETEGDHDPMVRVKFFFPAFHWTWYGIEFDGDDQFFGFVDGDVPEVGYFSLSELEQQRDALGCPIERDLGFAPCRLSELRQKLNR